ncbi:MAG: sulfotransferase domain-containing protein [Candidatus Brocadiaceae bacterium]|nr:sulfotransferase domain-containing protein [Candidatus Brocadiaceae bacterium]
MNIDRYYRFYTSSIRMLPDVVIAGAVKCGTTFLYELLCKHPFFKPAATKEIHYFDLNYGKGINWYRSFFPVKKRKQNIKTGEASPYYLFHPHVPKRMYSDIPSVKLIMLLRNPVERAYSQYHHITKRKGDLEETLSFEDAVAKEKERLQGETKKMLQNETYQSLIHRRFSYLTRGIYIDQIEAFAKFFDRSQMLIIKSEELFSDTVPVFDRVLTFLDMQPWTPKDMEPVMTGSYSEMKPDTRRQLVEYFQPYNQRLYEYLGENFGWQ